MPKQPRVVTIEHEGSSGPTAYTETVTVETVESPGLVTQVVHDAERRVLNPETLPSGGPVMAPRRRARR